MCHSKDGCLLRFVLFLSLTSSLIAACRTFDEEPGVSNLFKKSYTGYTLEGQAQTCYPQGRQEDCPPSFQAQQEFHKACTQAGFEAYFCRCDHYLCSSLVPTDKLLPTTELSQPFSETTPSEASEFSGFDLKGAKQRCQAIKPGQMCTMVYTEAEAFAAKCRSLGHKAFQCGCHAYLCSNKIAFESSQPSATSP